MNLPVSFLAEVRFHVASCCRRHARAKRRASRLVFYDPMLLPQMAPVGPDNPARTRARGGRPKFRLPVPAPARHVLTRGHAACRLSTLRPLLPAAPLPRLRLQRFQAVAAMCGEKGAPVPAQAQATVSPDLFFLVRRLPGTHRAWAGTWVFIR